MIKRLLVFAFIIGLVGLGAAAARPQLTVGIDQSSRGAWTKFLDSFTPSTGIEVSLQPYPASSLGQQIVLAGLSRSGKFNLVMVHKAWTRSLSRYLVDLSGYADEVLGAGAAPVYVDGRLIGTWISFAPDWFLGVIAWPDDPDAALALLRAMGGKVQGEATSTPSAGVSPMSVVKEFTTTKTARAEHNPKLDGSLEVLLDAAKATVGAMAAEVMGKLPPQIQTALTGLARIYGIPYDPESGEVTVVLESWSPGTTANSVAALGVNRSAIKTGTKLVKVTVSLSELPALAKQIAGVAFIRPPYQPYPLAVSGEGVAAIGADAYHAAGITGSGVKIAIIDLGFSGLSQAQARGDIPYSVVQKDFTGTGLTTGITHGTAVAEIVHEVAPDAKLYLIKIADEVDLDQAVTYCLNNGIDIINHSLGWYNTNFYDGTGTIADIATRAIQGGILWVNAAGNEAQNHWEGTFTDTNSDTWLDQPITFYATAGSYVTIYMTWNDWPHAASDYDLYLYGPGNNLVTSSTKHQTGTEEPTESIQTTVSATGTYTIKVKGSGSKRIEIYNLYQHLTPAVASSSILAPGNVADVVTVGAVDWAHYTTGPIEPYSSQGPTNDGRVKPDLVAPDNVTTGTSPYTSFAGTSGAAPEVAGAAALLLSQDPSLTAAQLRARLLSQTVPMGSQYVYGHGRLSLSPPTPTNQPPHAAFNFSPGAPLVGTLVAFNASASSDPDGSIVSYSWNFGDGQSGSGVTIQHAYSAPGTYTVRLTVTDDDGASDTATQQVTVTQAANTPPNAAFTYSPTDPAPGTWVHFDATSSHDPDGTITSYSWNFGDGSTGSGASVYHRFTSAGTYTVRLTVTDDDGASDTVTQQVVVQVATPPPTADAGGPYSGTVGQPVTLSGTGSTGTITSYSWNFGDGHTASGSTVTHSYAAPGTYTATLTVSGPGGTDTDTAQVVISPAAPALSLQISLPKGSYQVGESIVITYTVNRPAYVYICDADPSGKVVLLFPSYLEPNNYVGAGTHTLPGRSYTLRVDPPAGTETLYAFAATSRLPNFPTSFGSGFPVLSYDPAGFRNSVRQTMQTQLPAGEWAEDTLSFTVTQPAPNQPPVAAFTYSPTSPQVGQAVHFDASSSHDPDGSIVSYSWNFGDGHTAAGVSVAHSYSHAGSYTVRLTVRDDDGASATKTKTVSVAAAPSFPVLRAHWAFNEGSGATAGDSSGNGNNGTIHGASWVSSSPDGSTALSFDGSGDYVAVPASASLAITGKITVEAWINPSGPSGTQRIVSQDGAGSADNHFYLALEGNKLSFAVYTNTWKKVTGTTALQTGTWYHVAGVYTGSKLRVYLNGHLEKEITVSGQIGQGQSAAPVTIGAKDGGSQGFNGTIDEVRIYADALGPSGFTLLPSTGNIPPIADFTFTPTSPHVNDLVRFHSTSTDPDGQVVWWSWSFGDGGVGTGGGPAKRYRRAGTYTVTLTVRDDKGAESTVSKQITVLP